METQNPFRLLPQVDEVLARPVVTPFVERVGRDLCRGFVQDVLADWRGEISAGLLDADGVTARLEGSLEPGGLVECLRVKVDEEAGRGVVKAVNVAGVVLHTGLGRAPVHPEAAAAMATAAGSYCVLEVDRFSGQRNRRDDRLSKLLQRLTGCEAAIAVNNNAAACVLALSTFAKGKETIVSRGELVEIGGSFRMPDVMEQAGTKLVGVGATNRTRIADFKNALTPETGMLLKVHTSNYAMIGFTEETPMEELAELARANGLPSVYDLGAGFLNDGVPGLQPIHGLEGEPLLSDAIRSGADVVTFSGDKLFGGPQAGILAGNLGAIEDMRKHPLYRAMRLDKVGLAGLEKTCELYLSGRGDEIPARALMRREPGELQAAAERLAGRLAKTELVESGGATLGVEPGKSQPGSGSAPGILLDTTVVRLVLKRDSAEVLAARLRAGDPPVFTRIADEALVLDPRGLLPGDEDLLVAAIGAL
ncbi:MAG: L-seryl-tRNA(Sec) selenium transferase [Planctomycetota bacterium]|nr:L-seryl-tRNA(Sec) selenium transferase [Planctomycetota bacterium]